MTQATFPVRRILVPTAFGESQATSLAWADELASCFDARVTLLHVLEADAQQVMLTVGGDPYRVEAQLLEQARARLADAARGRARVDEVVVEVGSAAAEVSRYARENADLVVIARHSRRGTGDQSVLGSVVRRVKRADRVPVLLVDSAPPDGDGPLVRSLFVASDGGSDSARGIAAALAFARALGVAQLTAGHVVQTPGWMRLLGEGAAAVRLERLVEHAMEQLQAQVADAQPQSEHFACAVRLDADVPSAILDLVHEAGADLLVVPTHGLGAVGAAMLGSTSARLVQLSRRPVLLLPRDWLEAHVSTAASGAAPHGSH